MSGFSIEDMPLTFQNAVVIARKLSVDYIWIDSLCIRQDDPLDWEVEVKKMVGVYSGSYCNIAATAASNAYMGLFCQSDDRWMAEPCFVKVGLRESLIVPDGYWAKEMDSQPLMQRGWIV
jgi:Heterokaryon incompatibility protein (HET)